MSGHCALFAERDWISGAGLALGLAISSTFWYYVVKPARANTEIKQPFSISIATRMGTAERAKGGFFWLTYQSDEGTTVSPIQVSILMRLTNQQSVASMIESYKVEALNKNKKWVQLTRISLYGAQIYAGVNLKQASPISIWQDSLDNLLTNRAIKPNETIPGWAFFELPEDIPLDNPLRVYVRDLGGAEITKIVADSPDTVHQLGGVNVIGVPVDISNYPLRYWGDKNKPAKNPN